MFREFTNVTAALENSAAVVTLNRPDKRNALSVDMMSELVAFLSDCSGLTEVRSVIIAAAGKAFCSGHDLRELSGREEPEYRRIFAICTELMLAIQSTSVPVIAEVQGVATAAGCQLVAACD